MDKKVPISIFPSYTKITQSLKATQQGPYIKKLQKMNKKIEHIKNSINFDKEHRQISKKLVSNYRKQKMYEKPTSLSKYQNQQNPSNPNTNEDDISQLFQQLTVVENNINGRRMQRYADSVNQYLRNSQDEDENTYQMHLKFRKKALERQIQAEKSKIEDKKCIRSKQPNEEQEQFYRNLYKQGNNAKNQNHNPNNNNKQNQTRCAHLAQNKKKLTEVYLPYVQALDFTNVVKWRVLN